MKLKAPFEILRKFRPVHPEVVQVSYLFYTLPFQDQS
jgi:hypothetical protein